MKRTPHRDDGAPDIPPAENINPALASLSVPVSKLAADPANARKHDQRNLDAIKGSLSLFGQRKPIVVRRQGMVVIAGNGTLAAAKELCWQNIAAVIVNDDATTATAYGIADNRTAELAAWNDKILGTLLGGLRDTPIKMENVGFTEQEQINLIGLVDPAAMPDLSSGDRGADSLGTITIRLPLADKDEVMDWLESLKPGDPSGAILLAARDR